MKSISKIAFKSFLTGALITGCSNTSSDDYKINLNCETCEKKDLKNDLSESEKESILTFKDYGGNIININLQEIKDDFKEKYNFTLGVNPIREFGLGDKWVFENNIYAESDCIRAEILSNILKVEFTDDCGLGDSKNDKYILIKSGDNQKEIKLTNINNEIDSKAYLSNFIVKKTYKEKVSYLEYKQYSVDLNISITLKDFDGIDNISVYGGIDLKLIDKFYSKDIYEKEMTVNFSIKDINTKEYKIKIIGIGDYRFIGNYKKNNSEDIFETTLKFDI